MDALRKGLDKTWLIAVAGLTVLACLAGMWYVMGDLSLLQLAELQTTFSSQRFAEIIAAWQAAGLYAGYKAHFQLDFIFPLAYGLLFASLIARGLNFLQRRWTKDWLVLVPLIAALCDMGENYCHLAIMDDPALLQGSLVAVSASLATAKWVGVVVSLAVVSILWQPGNVMRRA